MAQRNGFPMRYLGDGVYASFDGYQIWLHVGSHEAPPVVALDPSVLVSLSAYYRDLVKAAWPAEPEPEPKEIVGEERMKWLKDNGYES